MDREQNHHNRPSVSLAASLKAANPSPLSISPSRSRLAPCARDALPSRIPDAFCSMRPRMRSISCAIQLITAATLRLDLEASLDATVSNCRNHDQFRRIDIRSCRRFTSEKRRKRSAPAVTMTSPSTLAAKSGSQRVHSRSIGGRRPFVRIP